MSAGNERPGLNALCVFCGSSPGFDPRHMIAATRLGVMMAERGITLVYGGGHVGLMGAVADAVMKGGGRVVGIIPEHRMRWEVAHLGIHELIVVDSMHTRKKRMFDLSDAFCVLPGGLGTMDETFEILTWKQLKLHNKPVIVLNEGGYWDDWLRLTDSIIAGGFARNDIRALYHVVETVEQVLPTAAATLPPAVGGDSTLF